MINSRKGSCSLRRSKSNSTQFKNLLRTNLKNSTRIQIMDRLTQIQNSIDNVCGIVTIRYTCLGTHPYTQVNRHNV